MRFVENTRKPLGLGGAIMVSMMNIGHSALADCGFRFLPVSAQSHILDCGCGGGANLKKLLRRYPNSAVHGIDYSVVSVDAARRVNQKAVQAGRCHISCASVAELPYDAEQFELVTAFETVYFWPGLSQCFDEIHRVLRPGGMFLICNECSGDTDKDDTWVDAIPGMTIYPDHQLKAALEQVGFSGVQIHKNKKGWLCVTARK